MTRKKDADSDDQRAFEQAVQGVRPLAADRRRTRGDLPPAKPARGPRPTSTATSAPTPRPAPRLRAIEPAGDDPDARYAYLADGESTDRLRELRASRRVDAELDLHGQTSPAAVAALARFVAAARQREHRLLLIVHGRGRGSGAAGPVLRQLVIEQLAAGPLSADVLAVASAPPALGGAGAALVLLRRRR